MRLKIKLNSVTQLAAEIGGGIVPCKATERISVCVFLCSPHSALTKPRRQLIHSTPADINRRGDKVLAAAKSSRSLRTDFKAQETAADV